MAANQDSYYVLEEVELEESDSDVQYDEVPERTSDSDSDDLQDVLETIKKRDLSEDDPLAPSEITRVDTENRKPDIAVEKKPTVIDDFIRNFLIQNSMSKTLDVFQREWYEKQNEIRKSSASSESVDIGSIPDVYVQKQMLEQKIKILGEELERKGELAGKVKSTWNRLRNERDFHRMHHRRVVQEKNHVIKQMKRLKNHCDKYEPTLRELKHKYEGAIKAQMLMRLEKDKMALKVEALETQLKNARENQPPPAAIGDTTQSAQAQHESNKSKTTNSNQSRTSARVKHKPMDAFELYLLQNEGRTNPNAGIQLEPTAVESFALDKTYSGHSMAVSSLALHPSKDIVATTSDDLTWKLWNLQNGELIMSGEGHRDWVSSSHFHPSGTFLATGSGDGTVKIWNFAKSCCSATLSDHTQAVWSVAFHESGDVVASSSMDHTSRLWDIESQKCRQTFRGHVDSVNYICFQPYMNNLCTASGDKTISFWDLRSGLCIQTFYGHHNAVNYASFSKQGNDIVSCDADGIVKVWDIRMIGERLQINTGDLCHSCSCAIFDQSGEKIVAASDDFKIKVYNASDGGHVVDLAGHEDSVNRLMFSHDDKTLVSASSDCTFRVWK